MPKTLEEFNKVIYNKSENLVNEIISLEYDKIVNLKGLLTNREVRLWYKKHDENILKLLDYTQPLKEQALKAHELRNMYRIQARNLMKDQKERELLDINNPNQTFEEMMKHKELKYGLVGDEAYKDIIRSSRTTNKKYDELSGIKE